MSDLFPVILSGGSGTRLWPLSRYFYPKQFMPYEGDTLFGQTLERVRALPETTSPIVICNQEHRFLAASIMQEKGLPPDTTAGSDKARLILEPEGRNTAPAIAVAAFTALADNPDAVLLVLPSDHKIFPQEGFAKSAALAAQAARQGRLVTFGIQPTHPSTGYGYILKGEAWESGWAIKRFAEKPGEETAKALIAEGGMWNSGMFVFSARTYLDELQRHAPAIHDYSRQAWEQRNSDLDFIRLAPAPFSQAPNLSIDYAVMEHTDKAVILPLHAAWHDLGSWESFYEVAPKDNANNSVLGDVELLDSKNCYVHATSRLVAGIGLNNTIVVESPDAVLIAPQGRGQDVKILLDTLKQKGRTETETHLTVHRPWGSYETLILMPRFQVKRIIVKPGGILSLQMHHQRAEHWVVVSGTAQVTVEEQQLSLTEDQSVYIPVGAKHRLENCGQERLELIEVQSGSYLGEDDIVRFEDIYNRS